MKKYYAHKLDNNQAIFNQSINVGGINIELTEEEYDLYSATPTKYLIEDDVRVVENPNYEQEQAEKERERLDGLCVTRGDMFEALLLAKQITKAQVRELIIQYVTDEVQQALMLNRFDEALNYYRGYPIFNLLGSVIGITPAQWDNYFEKATNEETKATAYKELM